MSLNITEYLESVSGQSFSNNSNVSKLFSGTSSSKNSGIESAILGGVDLTEYSTVKSGAYKNLLKKAYAKDTGDVSDKELEAFKKKQEVVGDRAASFTSALNDMIDMNYTEENREKVTSGIKDLVDKYNSMMNSALSSDSKNLLKQGQWTSNMVQKFSGELSNFGISVDNSGKMTLDENVLKDADMTSIKSAFGKDINNIANKLLYKGEQMYSLAMTYGTSATAYTSDGIYKRDYSGSNFETTT